MKPFRKLTPAQTKKTFPRPSRDWSQVNRGRWVKQVANLKAEVERLLIDNAELAAERDHWQREAERAWRRLDRAGRGQAELDG